MMKKWMKNFEKNFTLATVGLAEVVVVTFVGWTGFREEDTWIISEAINDVGDDFGEKNSPWKKNSIEDVGGDEKKIKNFDKSTLAGGGFTQVDVTLG